MKKIMFATEFYDHAPKTFQYAVELAHAFDAELLMVHAYGKPAPRTTTDQLVLERREKVITKLTDFVSTHLPEKYQETIKVEYLAVNAYPLEGIVNTAREQEVDLIVMGMTGKTNRIGSLVGNTTLNVLTKAECQILMIPQEASFKGIKNLVYTLDFEFRDLQTIHYLKYLSQVMDAKIHALHVVEEDENEATVTKKMKVMKETFKNTATIEFELRSGRLHPEIEKFALDKQADIVCMIAHKHNFISRLLKTSELEAVAKEIHLPLLVIKEDAFVPA